jgi:hypothetical protein
MRYKLQSLEQQTERFVARVSGFGSAPRLYGNDQPTLLLRDVCLTSSFEELTDHVWISLTKSLELLKLRRGQILEFDAKVTTYRKKSEFDYKLEKLNNIKVTRG